MSNVILVHFHYFGRGGGHQLVLIQLSEVPYPVSLIPEHGLNSAISARKAGSLQVPGTMPKAIELQAWT
jgi:hypothetical protein